MIEFFFDCSSPWTYLAFHNIQPLAKEFGEEISWRPILVGGIFNSINPSVYAQRDNPVPAKLNYQKKDMADWARSAGLAIKMRPSVFPVNSVQAMRGCIFLGKDMLPFARAVFESHWGDDQDISQDAVLAEICKRVGVDPEKFFAGIGAQAIEDQLKPELPFTPGMEAAGDVVEVDGAVKGVETGDRVIVKMRHGTYCDEAVVSAAQLTPLPTVFDYAEGATFLAAHGTAYHALIDRGQVKPGETLLVHGAGGGVGLAAVELGKLLGATVIAAASSEEKLAVARAKGADHLVLYPREPFRDAVKRITDGRGADLVFDPVGGEILENSLRCIAWGARILIIGFTGGIGMARTNLVLIKGASVLGVRAGEAVRKNPALGEVRLRALTEWAEAGKIRPNVSHRMPLENYAQAMRLLIDRKAIGRVALMMR